MPYFSNSFTVFFVVVCRVCVCVLALLSGQDYLDKRKRGDFGITTANSVALRQAGHPPNALLYADDRLLHAQSRQV